MTTPNLFTPPPSPPTQPPPTQPPPAVPPPAPRRPRPRRGALIAAALVAVLVVGGSAVALLIPSGAQGEDPGVDVTGGYDALAAPALLLDGGGSDDPADQPAAPGRAGRGGGITRLGDDTLLIGAIVSATDGSVVVTPDGGPQRTLRTNDQTRLRGAGKKALADLKAGDRVIIRVDGSGDAATAVTIAAPRARAIGTVQGISGDTATITQVDGIAVPVNIAGVDPKPAVGDVVVLSGRATDATTITADRVRVLPKAS